MGEKITGYPERLLKIRGKDFADISVDDGIGGYDSRKVSGKLLENVLAESIDFDCQVGNEGTTSMVFVVDSDVVTLPKYITFENTAGAKGSGDVVFKIGSASGGSDIMPVVQLSGWSFDDVWPYEIMGNVPQILSSGTYFLTLITGSTGVNICNIRVHGNQFDV